jgi:hypothetical protein
MSPVRADSVTLQLHSSDSASEQSAAAGANRGAASAELTVRACGNGATLDVDACSSNALHWTLLQSPSRALFALELALGCQPAARTDRELGGR